MMRPSLRSFQRAKQAMRWARDAKREADTAATTYHRNFAAEYWRRVMLQHVRRALEWHRLGRELQREEARP